MLIKLYNWIICLQKLFFRWSFLFFMFDFVNMIWVWEHLEYVLPSGFKLTNINGSLVCNRFKLSLLQSEYNLFGWGHVPSTKRWEVKISFTTYGCITRKFVSLNAKKIVVVGRNYLSQRYLLVGRSKEKNAIIILGYIITCLRIELLRLSKKSLKINY